jgi:ATP-dependent 26S proteasome regulatory subunit
VILPFKHPTLYEGVKRPSGLLFTGVPGTGISNILLRNLTCKNIE